jgi:hypothetical protein
MPIVDRLSNIQDNVLSGLLSPGRLQRMIAESNREIDSYRVDEYLDDIRKIVFSELQTNKPIDNYRRKPSKVFRRADDQCNPTPAIISVIRRGNCNLLRTTC